MESRKRIKKVLVCAFLVATLLVLLTGCASMKNLFSWLPSWSTDDKGQAPSRTETAKAFQGVRPYEDPTHYYRKACYFQQRKKHRLAVQEFRKVIRIDPSHVEAYNGMGVSYDLMGDFSSAVTSYQEALRINPDLDYILNNLGYSYLLQGEFASAVETFKKAVELQPASPLYHNNLGLAYAKQGLHDMALAHFERTGGADVAKSNLAKILNKEKGSQKVRGPIDQAVPPLDALAKTKEAPKPETPMALSKRPSPPPATNRETLPVVEVEEERLFSQKHIVTQPIIYPESACEQTPEEIQIIEVSGYYGEDDLGEMEDLPQPLFAGSLSVPDIEIIAASTKSPVPEIISVPCRDNDLETIPERAETPPLNETREQDVDQEFAEVASATIPAEKTEIATTGPAQTNDDSQQAAEVPRISHPPVFDTPHRPVPDDSRTHEGITIEVHSFAKMSALAHRVGNDLIAKGLKVECKDDSMIAKNGETMIYYCFGYLQDAYTVAQSVPGYQNMNKVSAFSDPDTKVRIIFGRDLLPFHLTRSEPQKTDSKS